MKKIILGVAILAAIASCGKNKPENPDPTAAGIIHLDPNTIRPGRGAEATLLTMEGDANGFRVWAADNQGNPGWYDGISDISHKYDGTSWNFDPAKQWPADESFYPIRFHAVFPSTHASIVKAVDANAKTVGLTVTVGSSAAGQVDILAASTSTTSKPASGNLAMTFHHILSKVNFALDLSEDYTVAVQGLAVNTVGDTGTYTVTNATPAWTTTPTAFTSTYTYYGELRSPATGGVTVINAPDITGTAGTTTPFYTTTTTPTAANANLMLMPQDVISRTWGGTDAPTALPTAGESYISMVYRLREGTTDIVGFTQAQNHPDWTGSDLADGGYPATAPLFVKVGYPFVLTWLPGKGYTYNIALNADDGATGGYLIDEFYYDHFGNATDLTVNAETGSNVPDPVLGDGDIHLIPVEIDWDEESEGVE